MDRREVVNNPDEYVAEGLSAPVSTAPGSRTAFAHSRSSTMLSLAPGDSRDRSFPRPTVESIPQISPGKVPSSSSGPDQPVFSQLPNIQVLNRLVCLYLGPASERCDRPALDNGFCPSHQPNASPTALHDESRSRKKKAAATVGVIAMMWPLIEELIRQILRLLR